MARPPGWARERERLAAAPAWALAGPGGRAGSADGEARGRGRGGAAGRSPGEAERRGGDGAGLGPNGSRSLVRAPHFGGRGARSARILGPRPRLDGQDNSEGGKARFPSE